MKTTMLLTALLSSGMALSGAAHAASIPDGTFRGEGLWKSAAARGSYEVVTAVAGDKFSSTYTFGNGQKREVAIELEPAANGFLKVLADGREAGSGYCLERVALCHYSLKTDKISLEETMTIQDGKLYKFGSKTEAGVTVMWQEALGK